MRFPRVDDKIVGLAKKVVRGLTDHTAIYANPPLTPEELQAVIQQFDDDDALYEEKKEALKGLQVARQRSRDAMAEATHKEVRYAENTVGNDEAKLALIGWGVRKPPKGVAAPQQPRDLTADRADSETVVLTWKRPATGAAVDFYRVYRAERTEGPWKEVAVLKGKQVKISGEPSLVELVYQVIAENNGGLSVASNIVSVVL